MNPMVFASTFCDLKTYFFLGESTLYEKSLRADDTFDDFFHTSQLIFVLRFSTRARTSQFPTVKIRFLPDRPVVVSHFWRHFCSTSNGFRHCDVIIALFLHENIHISNQNATVFSVMYVVIPRLMTPLG